MAPLPFLTSREPFCACVVGEVSLTSRIRNMWSFIFYLGRAQPPPSSCFYGVSAIMEFLSTREKLFSLGSIYLLPQILPERHEPQEIFIGRRKDKGLSSVASSGCQGACRPYLVGGHGALAQWGALRDRLGEKLGQVRWCAHACVNVG